MTKSLMSRVAALVAALALVATASASDGEAQAILRNIKQRFSGAESYRVAYTITTAAHKSEGVLHVDIDRSYMRNGTTEVYISDGVRYEVNGSKREIVIDKMSAFGGDMLGNPARGIEGLLTDFDVVLTTHEGHRALRLLAKGATREEEAAYIHLSADDRMERIIFGRGEGRVEIVPARVERNVGSARAFDAKLYEGFEIIDFR
ncbi:MAG: hypothetical protein IKA70_05370 [Alistipes sp.]|nr:hypothetical protein [Alistipes sp.]MBR2975477.1 hypothetical protein [Alistipes sp.]